MTGLNELTKELRIGSLEEFIDQVEYENKEQYITDILKLAVKKRRQRRIQRLIKQARFPTVKTLDGFDFTPVSFPESISRTELLSLEFIDRKENLLELGSVGTGKTHLAIALGLKACSQNRKVRFYRAVELTNELLEKHKEGQSGRLMSQISNVELLILDEMGYVPFSKQGAELLFSVISKSYEQQSIIITSNLDFGRWNEVFGDDRMTAALIDRLIHHAHILPFSGKSYRFKQAMSKKNGDQIDDASG